jgi:hypothetical protein
MRRLLLLVLAVLLIGGCRGGEAPDDSGLTMTLAMSPTPPGVGPARLIITLQDSTGAPVEGATVSVEGNMSHAGMVPVFGSALEGESGTYTISDFTFTMAGDWILTLEATLPDGRRTQLRKGTKVYSAPPGISPDTGEGAGGEGGSVNSSPEGHGRGDSGDAL